MAEYGPRKLNSKFGSGVVIRTAEAGDARDIYELSKNVMAEEIYQLTSASEFSMTVEAEEKWIQSHRDNPNHLLLVAEMDGKVVGLLDFSNGRRHRIAHTGEFGMSVEKSVRDQGIGAFLLQSLIDWATSHPNIEKISLHVHGNNERAIALYKKMGFEVEGVRRRELKYGDGQYIDSVEMARFV